MPDRSRPRAVVPSLAALVALGVALPAAMSAQPVRRPVAATRVAVASARTAAASHHRARNAVIGGVVGVAAGVGVCTLISNLFFDETPGRSTSTCTTKGNLIFGLGGFAVGAVIGGIASR